MRFILFMIIPCLLVADPWGKDADLACKPIVKNTPKSTCQTPIFGIIGEKVIGFHQEVLSPADGPRSHFIPSSSQYMLDAMRKHGFFKGFCMGCDRLMRENSDPWVYPKVQNHAGIEMKWDPVPDTF